MDIVFKSIAAAGITAVILLIAKFGGPKLAGVVSGVPMLFAINYILLTMSDKSISRHFLTGGIYGYIASIFFSILLIWLNAQFLKSHWLNFAIAYITCLAFAFVIVQFTSKQ